MTGALAALGGMLYHLMRAVAYFAVSVLWWHVGIDYLSGILSFVFCTVAVFLAFRASDAVFVAFSVYSQWRLSRRSMKKGDEVSSEMDEGSQK